MKREIQYIFRASTVKEEVEEVWQILNNYDWYKINNFFPSLSKNNEIDNLIQISLKQKGLRKKTKNKLKQIIEEIYDKKDYDKELNRIKYITRFIDKILPKLAKYNKLWNFNLLKKYEIVLTLYGTEGAYDIKNGNLFILIKKGEKNKNNYYLQTVIHEIIHIGIEDFVRKFRLTHDEKERIVDLYCQKDLKLENYKLQNIKDVNIDNFIVPNGFKNLPFALTTYIKNRAH